MKSHKMTHLMFHWYRSEGPHMIHWYMSVEQAAEKLFSWDRCQKRFTSKQGMKSHKMTHLMIRWYTSEGPHMIHWYMSDNPHDSLIHGWRSTYDSLIHEWRSTYDSLIHEWRSTYDSLIHEWRFTYNSLIHEWQSTYDSLIHGCRTHWRETFPDLTFIGFLALWILCHFSCFCFRKLTLSKNSFRNFIRVLNCLDPDQDRHFLASDLGPKCLQRLSADENGRH